VHSDSVCEIAFLFQKIASGFKPITFVKTI